MKKRLGTVARIFSPRSPTSLAASGSRNSDFGRWLSAARHPATMKAVSETFWMVWVMERTEDERAAKCKDKSKRLHEREIGRSHPSPYSRLESARPSMVG